MKMKILPLFSLGLVLAADCEAFDLGAYLDSAGGNDITAVTSRKAKSYVRVQLPNGTYVPETYVFGPGGVWRGEKVDSTIDNLTFLSVAHMIAGPLASQNYIPGRHLGSTKLLIMVYWGTTHGVEHATETSAYVNLQASQDNLLNTYMATGASKPSYNIGQTTRSANGPGQDQVRQAEEALMTSIAAVAAENHMRDQQDIENVNMLGYDSWWDSTDRYENTPMRFRRQDLLDEIEEDRYFVVLMAYDLEAMRRNHSHRELWETRFSIRERHHAFDEDLPAMARYASQYFGQDSKGLIHKAVPYGKVDIGAVKSLGDVQEPAHPTSAPRPTP
jgi:hypothetical protein